MSTRFAIVGLGYGGTRCDLVRSTPRAQLAAVVDLNVDRARTFGRKYDVPWFTSHKDLLAGDNVDVVAVYTPSGLHLDIAVDAMRSGKHLLLTKPMEVTVSRCDAILQEAADTGVQVFSEFYLRYYKDNLRTKRAIEAGLLGPLVLGEFAFKCYRPEEYYRADGAWRQTVEINGGGIVMNQAIHAIDQLIWLMGPPKSVQARLGTFGTHIPVEDTMSALFLMSSGAMATLAATTTFRTTHGMDDMYGGGYSTRAEVNGTSGSVSLLENEFTMVKLEQGEIPERGEPMNVFDDIVHALHDPEYRSMTLSRGREGRLVVEIAQAIYESARTAAVVNIGGELKSGQPMDSQAGS